MAPGKWTASDQAAEYGSNLLAGERVALRALHDEDLEPLAAWWNRPEWSGLQHSRIKPQPSAPIGAMIRKWSENAAAGADTGFSVVVKDTGDLIGHTTLSGASLPARSAEFAIMIGPDHVGRGYGTEAAELMVSYGFRELGLNRIGLSVWAYNTRAIRSYEKVGFQREGLRREAVFHNGTFHDEVLMSILARDYLPG